MIRILNAYAGIGGNRKLWEGVQVTAVERNPVIAAAYQKLYPGDKVIVGDAHEYILRHFREYDFVWSSPPCQSHTQLARTRLAPNNGTLKYPSMALYQEIILLQEMFKGGWVVENVTPYYKPLISPTCRVGRHLFWSSFRFVADDIIWPKTFHGNETKELRDKMMKWLGIYFEGNLQKKKPIQILRNCVHPAIGKQILDQYRRRSQSIPTLV